MADLRRLLLLAPLQLFLLGPPALCAPHAERAINVLLILSDQHSARATGFGGNGFGGAASSLTPALDRLATEGVVFDRAYCAAPQCQPSRLSLFSGRMPHEHGLRWNLVWEPRSVPLLSGLLRDQGYVTSTIGKHHQAWLEQPPPFVDDRGFDVVVDMQDYRQYCALNGQPVFDAPSRVVSLDGLPAPLSHSGWTLNSDAFHPSGYWADRVIEFLEERAGPTGDERPFFCVYAPYGPHNPLLPSGTGPDDFAFRFRPASDLELPPNRSRVAETSRLAQQQAIYATMPDDVWREALASYYGYVAQIDHGIGRVLNRLEELGLRQDTLVVYTSDHGEMAGEMGMWSKGGGNYEAVVRVPLVMRLPRALPAGRRTSALAMGVDLVPTVADLVGLTLAPEVQQSLDGLRLEPAAWAAPQVPAEWRSCAFVEFGYDLPFIQRTRTVIGPRWKLDYDERDGGVEQLFDLQSDPWELTNLVASTDPEAVAALASLRGELDGWWGDEVGHAPAYSIAGDEASPPTRAFAPSPAIGEREVARDLVLTWTPSTAASSQTVWFGTDPAALVPIGTLGPMAARQPAVPLAPSTTYHWRVDSANPNGSALGQPWSFTTRSEGDGGPGLPFLPWPVDGASDANVLEDRLTLRWSPPAGATTQTVWFAAAGEPLQREAVGLPGDVRTIVVRGVESGRRYRWRIDGTNASGITRGPLWSLTTSSSSLPVRATSPFPPHLWRDFAPGAGGAFLGWKSAASASEFRVFFGDTWPPPLVATTDQLRHPLPAGALAPGRTYWWRIDTVGGFGTRTGWTWRFTTAG